MTFSKVRLNQSKKRPRMPFDFLRGRRIMAAQRRRERERVEGRDQHRDGNRDGELLVEQSLDAAHEGHGHENGGQNERDADHRARDFFHRLDGRVMRRQAVLDVMLDGFDHHDRVVDHQTNRQDQAEQGKRVDRKAQHRKDGKGSD